MSFYSESIAKFPEMEEYCLDLIVLTARDATHDNSIKASNLISILNYYGCKFVDLDLSNV